MYTISGNLVLKRLCSFEVSRFNCISLIQNLEPACFKEKIMMIRNLIPPKVKVWLISRIREITSAYIPYKSGSDSFYIPKSPELGYERCKLGLPIPPKHLWHGYGSTKEEYLSSGEEHVNKMLKLVHATDFSFEKGHRILDFGCGGGRMVRHLKNISGFCEIWGTDIVAEYIYWCRQHLSPPFHFATTTTIPHLPFKDEYFNFIYCASIFTHIDNLAEAWLLELRRILSPNGRLYLTIHDNRSIELLEACKNEDFFLAELLKTNDLYVKTKHTLGMLAIGRDIHSQVFYDIDYFCQTLSSTYQVLSITKEAYGYQTAVLVKPK
jgi:SAM-dependent methyltransferase